jgi:hypothetical protein
MASQLTTKNCPLLLDGRRSSDSIIPNTTSGEYAEVSRPRVDRGVNAQLILMLDRITGTGDHITTGAKIALHCPRLLGTLGLFTSTVASTVFR